MHAIRDATVGHTLVELLIVVALLAVIAGAVMQHASVGVIGQLDAALDEVSGALRFARSEAMRTRVMHGVDFGADPANGARRVRLFRVDGSVPPAAVYDVRHPVSKKVFDILLASHPGTGSVALTQATFHFKAGGPVQTVDWVAFDDRGTPEYYPDAAAYAAYEDATAVNAVTLASSGQTARLRLDAVTGRVKAQ